MRFRGVSIIIPVYNEQATISAILDRVQKTPLAGLQKEIIVVDDGSTDGTNETLKKRADKNIKVLRHSVNRGKGAAIQTALQATTQDIVLIQDADLEYRPEEYEKLLKPIVDGAADVVYGSRFIGSCPHRVLYFWHYLGNKIITFLTDIFANLNLTDIETGAKAFTRTAITSVQLCEPGFGFEPEVTIKLARKKWRFYEVGVSYFGRDYAEGKKIRWTDGIKALWVIIKNSLV